MKFEPNQEQKEIIKASREFAKAEFDPDLSLNADRLYMFPVKILKKACRLGFVGIHFPESFYGQEMGLTEYSLVAEALCRQDSTLGSALLFSRYAAECILQFASDTLKKKTLSKIGKGTLLCGGNFSYLDNRDINLPIAIKKDDHWSLAGKQKDIINGGGADIYCILCHTQNDNGGPKSISMILVEKKWEGVTVSASSHAMGVRAANISDIAFDDVKVPFEYIVGDLERGFQQAQAFMNLSRIQLAGMAIGIAQGAFEIALKYTKEREQFGSKLASFQMLRHRLADMAVDINKARLLTYEAAINFDNGNIDPGMTATAKLAACRCAVDVSFKAIQLLGGYGYMSEYHVERYYRDAKMLEIAGGTPDQLRDLISDAVIGKVPKVSQ